MSAAIATVISYMNGRLNIESAFVDKDSTEEELRLLQVFQFVHETVGEEVLKRISNSQMCTRKDIKCYAAKLAITALDQIGFSQEGEE